MTSDKIATHLIDTHMARGRIPKPKVLNDLKGDPSNRRRTKREPKAPEHYPTKPDYLEEDPIASEEWDSMCGLLESMGLLSCADRASIEMYCSAYSRYRNAEINVRRSGEVIISPRNKYPMVSPYVSVLNKNLDTCRKLLLEFGLTPAARSRMSVAIRKDDDTKSKWSGLVA